MNQAKLRYSEAIQKERKKNVLPPKTTQTQQEKTMNIQKNTQEMESETSTD